MDNFLVLFHVFHIGCSISHRPDTFEVINETSQFIKDSSFLAFKMNLCYNMARDAAIIFYEYANSDWQRSGYSFRFKQGPTEASIVLHLTFASDYYLHERTYTMEKNVSCIKSYLDSFFWISWAYGKLEMGRGQFYNSEKRVALYYPSGGDLVDVKYVAIDGGSWVLPLSKQIISKKVVN